MAFSHNRTTEKEYQPERTLFIVQDPGINPFNYLLKSREY
jgi:hypothetical protein